MRNVPCCTAAVTLGTLLLLVDGAFAAAPDDTLSPGIVGTDDRVMMPEKGAPWDAVGQINVGGQRMTERCTGTLVSPTVVVTAAHCLHPPGPAPHPAHNVHFLAGLDRGSYKAHGIAKCTRWHSGWSPSAAARWQRTPRGLPLEAFVDDAGIIVLSEPMAGVVPAPLGDASSVTGSSVLVHAAYPADRRQTLSADPDCRLSVSDRRLWLTDCDTAPASSGGPVFAKSGSGLSLVGIMAAAGNGDYNVAVPATAWRTLLDSATCP